MSAFRSGGLFSEGNPATPEPDQPPCDEQRKQESYRSNARAPARPERPARPAPGPDPRPSAGPRSARGRPRSTPVTSAGTAGCSAALGLRRRRRRNDPCQPSFPTAWAFERGDRSSGMVGFLPWTVGPTGRFPRPPQRAGETEQGHGGVEPEAVAVVTGDGDGSPCQSPPPQMGSLHFVTEPRHHPGHPRVFPRETSSRMEETRCRTIPPYERGRTDPRQRPGASQALAAGAGTGSSAPSARALENRIRGSAPAHRSPRRGRRYGVQRTVRLRVRQHEPNRGRVGSGTRPRSFAPAYRRNGVTAMIPKSPPKSNVSRPP